MRRAAICLIYVLILVLASVASAQQQKTIKDPAEYNAYIAALNTEAPPARAAAMEAFVGQYPNSVVKIDALEQAMAAYQKAENQGKLLAMAKQILKLEPNNIRALAVATAMDRAVATAGGPKSAAALKETCSEAQTGLQLVPGWQKPEGLADADFAALSKQLTAIFSGAAGFCALQSKDYPSARNYYEKALQIDSTDLQNAYQLAVADLEPNPIEVKGLWYCAKAIKLAQQQKNAPAASSMAIYCKAKYKRYHGGEDGWNQLAESATGDTLPSNFAVKPAPTPCELAVMAVEENKPEELSFSDQEFILAKVNCSAANKDAADKVWQSIQKMEKGGEARLQIPVKVISATRGTIEAAISDDNQAANKADLHIELEKPAVTPPAPGTTINVIGVITKYDIDPFMFTMEKGQLPAAKPLP